MKKGEIKIVLPVNPAIVAFESGTYWGGIRFETTARLLSKLSILHTRGIMSEFEIIKLMCDDRDITAIRKLVSVIDPGTAVIPSVHIWVKMWLDEFKRRENSLGGLIFYERIGTLLVEYIHVGDIDAL